MRAIHLLSISALICLGAPRLAQAAYAEGDLYLMSQLLPGIDVGIVRIDPITKATSTLLDIAPATTSGGLLAYDPFRDRLLYVDTVGIRDVDSSGSLGILAAAHYPKRIASRGDGIVYLWYTEQDPIRYLDAADTIHDLLDEAGTGSYMLPGTSFVIDVTIYHEPTNSLILVGALGFGPCVASNDTCAVKLPLTADGTQVAGPLESAQVSVSGSAERPVGIGYGPGDSIYFIVDTNSNDQEPRMQLLDPHTMTLSTFAESGAFTGAAVISAGTYSNVNGVGLLFDTNSDLIRAYMLGETGTGTTFLTGLSGPGFQETARMVEVWSPGVAVPALQPWLLALLPVALLALAFAYLHRDRARC